MHRQMPSIQRIWSGPGWLCAKRSVVPMSSPNDLHFPLQIGVKWRDAATTFPSFCSPRSPNRTGFGMGRLKPRPTFSLHSSRYWMSSRRASVARAHVVSFSFCNFRCSRQWAYCSRFARWRSSSSFGRNRNLSRDPRSVITLPQLCLLKQWQVFSGEWQRKTLPWQHGNYLCRLSGCFFLLNLEPPPFPWRLCPWRRFLLAFCVSPASVCIAPLSEGRNLLRPSTRNGTSLPIRPATPCVRPDS